MSGERVLVGDIGGTHARFAIACKVGTQWSVDHRSDIETEAANFEDVLHGYLEKLDSSERPTAAAIAVAGPVTDGKVSFTNRNWQLSEEEFTRQGFQRALLINDFAALAFAAAEAQPHELFTLGPDIPGLSDEPISNSGGRHRLWRVVPGALSRPQCAHRHRRRPMSFAPGSEKEIAVLRRLTRRFGRVSVERILSGPGIEYCFWRAA